MDQYRRITTGNIEKKKNNPSIPMDTSQPNDVFFKVIDDRIQYSREANTPFTPSQVLLMAYNNASPSRIYIHACKYWHRNPPTEKI